MEEILNKRYQQLFYHYESGAIGMLAALKQALADKLDILRPDAALCLLVLYDQMILRPYGGHVLDGGVGVARPSLTAKMSGGEFSERVLSSLTYLVDRLQKKSPRAASSHDVLVVINESWEYLSGQFAWAK